MSKKKTMEFYSIVQDIVNNEEFNKLNNELHHGITAYAHSLRVAKWTYKVSKALRMKNMKKTTRAALLHDFYLGEDLDCNGFQKLREHPKLALQNSMKYYELDNIQQDIIVNHMFPCTLNLPKYKESYLVSTIDKIVSTYEILRFKLSLKLGIYFLFLFEIIRLPE